MDSVVGQKWRYCVSRDSSLCSYKLLHPIAQAKLQDETSSIKVRTLQIADDLAATIVPELALMSTLSNEERKAEAIKFINRKLSLLDLQLTEETVSAKVEKSVSRI
ncbi:hypothetical protein [Secundilactobacillus kimchicus]|uniref:hypothetical protein n=1 Tax=Secundilactobacillus kimchicus TaxID=528209 RepID=UPI0006CF826E|nr:hypothetical protein [Secundilactobacillus kimchicus]